MNGKMNDRGELMNRLLTIFVTTLINSSFSLVYAQTVKTVFRLQIKH